MADEKPKDDATNPEKKKRPGSGRRGRGRQPEITPAKINLLVKAIGNGTPRKQAARLARIDYSTYRNWMNWGEEALEKAGGCEERVKEADKLYVDLFLRANEAIAKTVDEALSNIRKAGKKNWQADAWLLTRLCAAEFADNRHEIAALKKGINDLLKELAELKNTKVPEPLPPEGNPDTPVPMPTPGPELPPTSVPTPVAIPPKPEGASDEQPRSDGSV